MTMEFKTSLLSPLGLPTLADWVVVLMLVMGFASLADWRRQNPGESFWLTHDQSDHIGAEYDTIAQAIRHGRGFSDPFHDPTGPTAWMPPVLVYWTAAIYAVCGDNREYVVEIIVACSLLVVIFSSILVVGQARRLSCPKVGYMILAMYLAGDFFDLFQMTHDTWLILFVLALLWLGMVYLIEQPASVSLAWKWRLLGGFAALCSPVVGFAWAALTTWLWFPWRSWESRDNNDLLFKSLLLAAVVSIVVVTPWMIRNRIMLGKWIPGRMKQTGTDSKDRVSRSTIEHWIRQDEHREHWESLLRRRGKRRPKGDRRGHLSATTPITGRPAAVDERSRCGDWEGDTIVSPVKRSGLISTTDRRSGLLKLDKVENLKSTTIINKMHEQLLALPAERRLTMTLDDGKKFAQHARLSKLMPEGVYFARPAHPWERGANENTNGLVRQFVAKGSDIANISHQRIKQIKNLLNERPRKRLGYQTPNEVFTQTTTNSRCI